MVSSEQSYYFSFVSATNNDTDILECYNDAEISLDIAKGLSYCTRSFK